MFSKRKARRQKIDEIHAKVALLNAEVDKDVTRTTAYRKNGDFDSASILIASCIERNELCKTLLDEVEAMI
jgi:hypothetical protein